ncbi:hypothetical protein DSO57_1038565 [Entomophthora muscae]|uniref:Uncharacterized protein n=1 Tax=Entomophthora muscae TaxID=34485 RepID=A0ACC2RDN5_9FUNG|nr:hypothetical protein DSO57_1038565 [Entomophthora muscae]
MFEVMNYLKYIDCSEAAVIAVVRVVSSLRTISVLNSLEINNHVARNGALESTLRSLACKCNLREKDNRRLSKQIADKLKTTKQTQVEMNTIRKDILVVQKQVWHQIVPTSFILGLSNNKIRDRMERSQSHTLK